MRNVEFFFDLSSPWTYLAFVNLQPVLQRTGATAVYRPVLVGGVFNAVNPGKGVRIGPITGSWYSRSYSGMGRLIQPA